MTSQKVPHPSEECSDSEEDSTDSTHNFHTILTTQSDPVNAVSDDSTDHRDLTGDTYRLPPYVEAQKPHFRWGEVDGTVFSRGIDSAYLETVHWQNLFKIPPGKAGKAFVAEMARLLHAYAEASTLETVAL